MRGASWGKVAVLLGLALSGVPARGADAPRGVAAVSAPADSAPGLPAAPAEPRPLLPMPPLPAPRATVPAAAPATPPEPPRAYPSSPTPRSLLPDPAEMAFPRVEPRRAPAGREPPQPQPQAPVLVTPLVPPAKVNPPGTRPASWYPNACIPIYADQAWEVRNRLLSFDSVYGKKAIDWTPEDYDTIVALAQACHGVSFEGGSKFDARPWPGMITGVRNRVLPISLVARAVADRAAQIKPDAIRLPPCEEFLKFKFDTYAMTDSASDIFGLGFLAMSLPDLDRAVNYVNLCLAYLPDYAQIAGGWRKEATRDLLNRIMDRGLIVQKRRQEWESQPRYDTDLVLELDGVVVPATMASPDAREMIMRYNRSSATRRPFSPEAIGQLLRMAEDVLRDDRSAYDRLYANAVKARCQQEIFRK